MPTPPPPEGFQLLPPPPEGFVLGGAAQGERPNETLDTESGRVYLDQYSSERLQAARQQSGRFKYGLKRPALGAAQLIAKGSEAYLDALPDFLKGPKQTDSLTQMRQRIDDAIMNSRSQYQKLFPENQAPVFDPYEMAGGMVGTAPAALAALPARGASIARQMISGAEMGGLSGAVQPVEPGQDYWRTKGRDVGLGTAAGPIATGPAATLGRLISPTPRAAVKELMDMGVSPTPGQIMGGPAQWIEDKLTSLPLVGDAIKTARGRSLEDFNKGLVNKVLEPIGSKLPGDMPMSREAVEYAGQAVSKAYDDVLPKMTATVDQQFATDLQGLASKAGQILKPEDARVFVNKLQGIFTPASNTGVQATSGNVTIGGEAAKEVISKLRFEASKYGRSQNPADQDMADMFNTVKDSFSALLGRSNPPELGAQLATVDKSYAMLLRVENAAARLGQAGGKFSPAQFAAAVRQGDDSLRHRAYARGNAMMQDQADAGVDVLGQKIPNSGTVDRAMLPWILGGAAQIDPLLAGGVGAATLPYTPSGQKLLAYLLAGGRPAPFGAAGAAINTASPALASGVPYLLPSLSR